MGCDLLTSEQETVDVDGHVDVDAGVDVDVGVDATSDAAEAKDAERDAMTPNAPAPTKIATASTIHTLSRTTLPTVSTPTATTPCGPTKATHRCPGQNGKNASNKDLVLLHAHMDTNL